MKDILKYSIKQVTLFAIGINLLTTFIAYFASGSEPFDWTQSLVGDAFATIVIVVFFYFYKKHHTKNKS